MKTFVRYAGPGAVPASMIHCSFCHRTREEVSQMVAGPAGVFICDDCVQVCTDILQRDRRLHRANALGEQGRWRLESCEDSLRSHLGDASWGFE